MNKNVPDPQKGIGPLPVAGPHDAPDEPRIEDVETPLEIDMKDPELQELAKHVGWKRIFEIAKEEKMGIERAKEL